MSVKFLVFLFLFAFPAHAGTQELYQEYALEMENAKQLVRDPKWITGFERFQLAYDSWRSKNTRENIGQLLLVLQAQNQVVDHLFTTVNDKEINSSRALKNSPLYSLGLLAIQNNVLNGCKGCSAKELGALKHYIQIFDLKDMHDGFSGLPFYELVTKRFIDPRFRKNVIAFYGEILKLMETVQKKSEPGSLESAYSIALRLSGGKPSDAIELMAILTSRDVLITRYLKYLKSNDREFVRAFSNSVIVMRLITELDQLKSGLKKDRFSYPELHASESVKHYYFWSAAYAALQMKQLGYDETIITRVAEAFAAHYKTLRYLEAFGPLQSKQWKQDFKKSVEVDTRMTGAAAQFSLNQSVNGSGSGVEDPEVQLEYEKFQNFISKIKETKDKQFLDKKQTLEDAIQKNEFSKNKAYVLYYNFQSNIIGYPHLKLIIDGWVYEIHRTPNSDGTYLRKRPIVEALKDARRGFLPSGILEIQVSDEQKELVIENLNVITDGSMKYAFFNKLFSDDTYNCAGVIYDAFYQSGFGLPKMTKWDALAGTVIRKLNQNLAGSRFIGLGKKWFEDIQIPHWTLESIPQPLSKNRGMGLKLFSPDVGKEYLFAEQILVRKIPKGADPIHLLGSIFPSYSNTGTLDPKYAPTASPVLELTTLLIPKGDLKSSFSKSLGDSMRKIVEVEYQNEKYYRFFIHPNELEHYKPLLNRYGHIQDSLRFQATPTSSARSLVVKESTGSLPLFGIKLSLSVEMGAAKRLIDEERFTRSVYVSDMISDIQSETPVLPLSKKTWSTFKEVAAFLPREQPELGGYILREIPAELKDDIYLPVFSLIAKRSFEDRWIDELFDSSEYKDKVEFVFRELVLPALELHMLLDLKNGLTTEFHQQNLVVVIDRATRKIKGLKLKDMDAHWVDYSLRTHRLKKITPNVSFFPKDAYLLRYAFAPLNHFQSLVEILRSRNVINTFKYFLSAAEMKQLLSKFDQFAVSEFNSVFPEHPVRSVLEMEASWKWISSDAQTARERAIYESIRNAATPSTFEITDILKQINEIKTKCSLMLMERR